MAFLNRAALALAGTLATAGAAAQPAAFPHKPIRIIVPFPAGGTADSIPRIVAEKLQAKWGQPVVIENRAGAGGNVGAQAAFRSDPDGYTLLASPPGPLAINASLYRNPGYDVARFVPVSLLATMPNVLVARTTLPAQSVQELVALATKEPGRVSYASQGSGTTSHLSASLFQLLTGTKLLHIPYKGTAPALADLIGGQVDMMFDNVSSSLGQYKAGKVRILGVATGTRLASLPEVPTIEEAGVKDFRAGTWVAVVAPPNTPPEIAATISRAMAEIIRMPDVQKKFADLGGEAAQGTQAELATFLHDESARWKSVIQRANVTVEN